MECVCTGKCLELDWVQVESNTICYLWLAAPKIIELIQGNAFVLLCLQYLRNIYHTSYRSCSWCPILISEVKGHLLLQIYFHTRFSCYRIYREGKSNGNFSCHHPDLKRQHCSCEEEEEGEEKKVKIVSKLKAAFPFSSILKDLSRDMTKFWYLLMLKTSVWVPGG